MLTMALLYPRFQPNKRLTATVQSKLNGVWQCDYFMHWTERAATLYNQRGDVLSVIEPTNPPSSVTSEHAMARDLLGQAGLLT